MKLFISPSRTCSGHKINQNTIRVGARDTVGAGSGDFSIMFMQMLRSTWSFPLQVMLSSLVARAMNGPGRLLSEGR